MQRTLSKLRLRYKSLSNNFETNVVLQPGSKAFINTLKRNLCIANCKHERGGHPDMEFLQSIPRRQFSLRAEVALQSRQFSATLQSAPQSRHFSSSSFFNLIVTFFFWSGTALAALCLDNSFSKVDLVEDKHSSHSPCEQFVLVTCASRHTQRLYP